MITGPLATSPLFGEYQSVRRSVRGSSATRALAEPPLPRVAAPPTDTYTVPSVPNAGSPIGLPSDSQDTTGCESPESGMAWTPVTVAPHCLAVVTYAVLSTMLSPVGREPAGTN